MRGHRTWSVLVGLACLCGGAGRPTTRPVDRTIAALDAPNPAVRRAATEALINVGPSVRADVIAAMPTASPEAADRLALVLLRTETWDQPESAEQKLRLVFTDYKTLPADERAARVSQIEATGPATAALVHVLCADPSPLVRWAAADQLRDAMDPEPPTAMGAPAARAIADAARAVTNQVLALADAPADPTAYPAPSANAPLLAAAAWAAQQTDLARADALMGRALAIEAAHPSSIRSVGGMGPADFAYQWAIDRATTREDFAAAADLCRRFAARTSWSDTGVPDPVGDLFALHAEHGPFPGFEDDLRLYRPYLGRAPILYCLARLAERQGGLLGHGMASALTAAAWVASGTSVDDHTEVGRFLFVHGWPAAAGRELQVSLWLAGPDPSADVYLALHALANDCDDDAAAGKYLEGALRKSSDGGLVRRDRYGRLIPWTPDDQHAEVDWHYLRAAVTAGDREAALAQARNLLNLNAIDRDPGMAADIVPVLTDAGQLAQADRCFTAAYDALAAKVAESPADPMPKNNLAWLCARSDRHKDEADRLSAEAVRLAPTDAACLDTRAEVLFRAGRPKEAADLEARALAAKPEDVYMQRQIQRFRAAAGR